MTRQFLQKPGLLPTLLFVATMVRAPLGFTPEAHSADAVFGAEKACASAAAQAEVVLFEKALQGNRELVVVRGPSHSVADVAPPIMSKSAFKSLNDPKRGYFAVSIQVRPANGAALTLATQICNQWSDAPPSGGFEVHDVLVHDGLIVIAVSSMDIDLWQVTPYGDPHAKWPSDPKLLEQLPQVRRAGLDARWARDPRAQYINRKSVSVKLGLTRDGRVQADVVDMRVAAENLAPGETAQTRFVQVGDKWEFDVPKK